MTSEAPDSPDGDESGAPVAWWSTPAAYGELTLPLSWTEVLTVVDEKRARTDWDQIDSFLNGCLTTRGFGRPLTAGTLFLDEIGDLPPALQVKLLRALQERTFERVGGEQTLRSDFRLVAATNRNLAQAIGEGRFREDLFYRLNVVRIDVPSLRARRSDIPDLAEHFLRQHGLGRPDAPSGFTDEAMRALLLHDYPGNVRELENLIQRAVVLARGPLITLEDLPALPGSATAAGGEPRLAELLTMPMEQAVRALERMLITRALVAAGGNKTEAARLLQMRRQQLYARMAELGVE